MMSGVDDDEDEDGDDGDHGASEFLKQLQRCLKLSVRMFLSNWIVFSYLPSEAFTLLKRFVWQF